MHPHDHPRGGFTHAAFADSVSSAPWWPAAFLLMAVLLALGALYLWRRGWFGRPAVAAPEEEAKRILANRFARGDITADDFMERSAILNWTPGTTPAPPPLRRGRRP